MSYAVQPPYPVFIGLQGIGLSGGKVYVGIANQDPEIYPQPVYWDAVLTVPASQPLSVTGGYLVNAGSPANAFTAAPYSIRVRDKQGVQVFYVPNVLPGSDTILWVEMFGAKADWNGTTGTDNSAAFQTAQDFATAAKMQLNAGGGSYALNTFTSTSNLVLQGQGEGLTTLVLLSATGLGSKGVIYANSGSAGAQVGPLVFRDFTIDGRVAALGFEEHTHNMSLNGVKDVTIERVRFLGFRGDGLYLGSGINGGDERHNTNVKVLNCTVDGVNKDNRNGMSLLDYDGMTIRDTSFANMTKATMPGAIDVEPNAGASFAILNDLTIDNCSFSNIGGNSATISFPVDSTVPLPTGVTITNNSEKGTFRSFLLVNGFRAITAADNDMGMVVSDNIVSDSATGAPFLLYGCKGVTFRDNNWRDLASAATIGAAYKCMNIEVFDRFIRVGSGGGPYAILINDEDTITVTSYFEDCGGYGASAPVAGSAGIRFAAGTTANVRINGSVFAAPRGYMTGAVLASGNTFTPASNQFYGNAVGVGLTNQFQALFSDSIFTEFTPTIIGAATAGAGTYSVQEGQFQINGGKVTGWSRTIWSAHTGTGQTYAPTPTNVNNTVFDIAATVIGNNLAAVANPLGGVIQGNRVQVYQLVGNALVPQGIVASGELYITFSYPYAA